MEWQPIDTVPMDGTRVLVWAKDKPEGKSMGFWIVRFCAPCEYWFLRDDDCIPLWPTHWMLPPAPEQAP
jgi:hypothetical protein